MKKRFWGIVLGAGMLLSCGLITACSGSGGGGGEVAGKTNITVGTYNGGVGKPWLEAAAKRFEKAYEEVSFEEGKTGVAVRVTDAKAGTYYENGSLDSDVFFTE